MRNIFVFVFVIFGVVNDSFGQDVKTLVKEGNNHLEYERYRRAASKYKLVLQSDPENAEAHFNMGVAYVNSYKHQESLEFMEKALSLSSKKIDKHQNYWLGKAYHLNYKFDEAIKYYKLYKEDISKSDLRQQNLTKLILECNYAKELLKKKGHYRINNVGEPINTKIEEHSPIITQDGRTMMFTSRKYTETGEDSEHNFSEQIMISTKDENNNWSTPKQFSHNLDGHDATVHMYDNDSKLIIYRNSGAGDLFISTKEGSDWSDPEPFVEINSKWTEVDAYVSYDGNLVVYSSTFRSPNHEHTDLFSIRKDENGKWSEPQSLGENINTKYDEGAAHISTDGKTLFFSSKGHNSIGGFDVFKSRWDEASSSWGKPENLGYPLNTPSDDIYFYYSHEDNWSGYFSSYRRDGFGEKDIYKVTFIPNVFVKGKVIDASTGEVVTGAAIEFLGEGDEELMDSEVSDSETGQYLANLLADKVYAVQVKDEQGATLGEFEYTVPILKDDDPLDYTFDLHLNGIGESLQEAVVVLPDESTISVGEEESEVEEEPISNNLVAETEQEADFSEEVVAQQQEVAEAKEHFKMKEIETGCKRILHHVYFNHNQAVLKEESYDELSKLSCLMSTNSSLTVEIGGHTDNIGNDMYNKRLSAKRAQAVVNYLKSQGIDSNRLKAVGYGETHPIASNDDEEEGRELNRRTEFKITSN